MVIWLVSKCTIISDIPSWSATTIIYVILQYLAGIDLYYIHLQCNTNIYLVPINAYKWFWQKKQTLEWVYKEYIVHDFSSYNTFIIIHSTNKAYTRKKRWFLHSADVLFQWGMVFLWALLPPNGKSKQCGYVYPFFTGYLKCIDILKCSHIFTIFKAINISLY